MYTGGNKDEYGNDMPNPALTSYSKIIKHTNVGPLK